MSELDKLKAELEKARDEIKLKMHLASMDTKTEWANLEEKWDSFRSEARLSQSGEGLSKAMSGLGHELQQAYKRIKDAL